MFAIPLSVPGDTVQNDVSLSMLASVLFFKLMTCSSHYSRKRHSMTSSHRRTLPYCDSAVLAPVCSYALHDSPVPRATDSAQRYSRHSSHEIRQFLIRKPNIFQRSLPISSAGAVRGSLPASLYSREREHGTATCADLHCHSVSC